MLDHDVFSLPTWHPGEGHPNVINEAMMTGMVILCTRHGFLEDVLPEGGCFFVEPKNPTSIAETIATIAGDPEQARCRATKARERLRIRFTSDAVIPELESIYKRLVDVGAGPAALKERSI